MLYTIAVGYLTHNIQIKNKNNKQRSLIQLACNQKTKTEFINVAVYGALCNSLKYAKKGQLLTIKGNLKIKKIDKQKGPSIYYTYVIADELTLM